MRKFLAGMLAFVIALGLASPVTLLASEINVTVNGNPIDFEGQPPALINGRTLVPVRGVFEALGFAVDWDQDTQTATLSNAQFEVVITIDSQTFKTNGIEMMLDVPAQIIDGRTMLPIRAVVQSIGMTVDWDQDTSTVAISRTVYEADPLLGSISMDFTPGSLANQLAPPEAGEQFAIMHTNFGEIHLRLFPDKAPLAVENFITHAQDGFYDGVIFHRVLEDFMIQGGDPLGTGMGGESIWGRPFGDEFTPTLRHIRGALAMANAGPSTNGSQFYIVQNSELHPQTSMEFEIFMGMMDDIAEGEEYLTYAELYPSEFDFIAHFIQYGGTPHLDFGHTVFGQVFVGMDVVDAIAATPVDGQGRPLEDVIIERIEIVTQ